MVVLCTIIFSEKIFVPSNPEEGQPLPPDTCQARVQGGGGCPPPRN